MNITNNGTRGKYIQGDCTRGTWCSYHGQGYMNLILAIEGIGKHDELPKCFISVFCIFSEIPWAVNNHNRCLNQTEEGRIRAWRREEEKEIEKDRFWRCVPLALQVTVSNVSDTEPRPGGNESCLSLLSRLVIYEEWLFQKHERERD